MSKASWDPACDGRRRPGRAGDAGVPWHVLLSQNDGPNARPPRHALYGQRLEAPTKRGGARDGDGDHGKAARVNDGRDHGRAARVADHGRSRRRTRSAAAGFGLQRRLVRLCARLPCFPPLLRNLAAAFLSAADPTVLPPVVGLATIGHCGMVITAATAAVDIQLIRQDINIATPAATPAVPPALLAITAPQARHSWPACLGRAAKQPTPAHRAAPQHRHTGCRATTRHHTPTVHACARRFGGACLQL